MPRIQRLFLGCAVLFAWGLVALVSGAANWTYAHSLGASLFEKNIMGGAAVASDIFKSVAFVAVLWFIATRHYWASFLTTVLAAIAVVFSVLAAIGFVSGERMGTFDRAQQETRKEQTRIDNITRLKSKANWVPSARPAQVVRADIQAAELHPHFRWSRKCKRPGKTTGPHCAKYRQLLVELASAQASASLEAKLDAKTQDYLDAPTVKRDYASMVIATLTGWANRDVVIASIFVMVALIETGAAFGLTIGLALLAPPETSLGKAVRRVLPKGADKGKKKPQQVAQAPQPQPVQQPTQPQGQITLRRPPERMAPEERLKVVSGA